MVLGLVTAFVVAFVNAKPKRRPQDDGEEFDDRPRRRDEDDFDDRQRPRDD